MLRTLALLKRVPHGNWHAVSKEHLHRDLADAEFRYNWRKMNDGQRVRSLVAAGNGAQLTYAEWAG